MSTLNDFVTQVQLNLGNRVDLTVRNSNTPSRVDNWLFDAYKDLAHSYKFRELELSIPDMFVPNIDTYAIPAQAYSINTISITGAPNMGINSPWPIRRRDIKVIRRYNFLQPGPPSVYAPYGNAIIIRPVPNLSYPFIWDVQQDVIVLNPQWNTVVVLQSDWNEILVLAATLRGHISLFERDKANELNILLYGDPKKKDRPGLIQQKLIKYEMENVDTEYSIRPLTRRYTNTV